MRCHTQYGGAIGGPIRKNRTFFFFNFEEWRLTQGYTVLSIVPTAAQRRGDFSQLRTATGALIPIYDPSTIQPSGSGYTSSLFPGNVIPASRLDKVAQNILPFWPLPNQQPANVFTNANNYQEVMPHPQAKALGGPRRRAIIAAMKERWTIKRAEAAK